jgi:hypothetical protein
MTPIFPYVLPLPDAEMELRRRLPCVGCGARSTTHDHADRAAAICDECGHEEALTARWCRDRDIVIAAKQAMAARVYR